MSIGYHITLGYNPHGTPPKNILEKLALSITYQELKNEFCNYETEFTPSLDKYLHMYFPSHDLTLKIMQNEIYQCASGGGEERYIKEGLRRAFCRLMLKKAHKEKIEISIHVA